MSDYDSPWKEALDHYLQPFMAFFFPQVHADIDWSRGYETLDKELQKIMRQAQLGRRDVVSFHAMPLARMKSVKGSGLVEKYAAVFGPRFLNCDLTCTGDTVREYVDNGRSMMDIELACTRQTGGVAARAWATCPSRRSIA